MLFLSVLNLLSYGVNHHTNSRAPSHHQPLDGRRLPAAVARHRAQRRRALPRAQPGPRAAVPRPRDRRLDG